MNAVKQWFYTLFLVWRREFRLIFSDAGVLIFVFALPLLYPVVYTLIYNPEVARKIDVVVVDKSSTAQSREFVRMVGQTETINILGHAANLTEAREALNEHKAFAILEIPADYSRRIGRGEQGVVNFYSDMSLLIRYRQFMFALTDVQLAAGARIQERTIEELGELGQTAESMAPMIGTESIILGDPTQGFASFVMPGILVLILQQSIVLSMVMLAGGAAERRRRNNGYDPLCIDAPPAATILGKLMCYLVLYLPMVLFTVHIVPMIFSLPHSGNIWEAFLLIFVMLTAAALFGQIIGIFATERETAFLIVVFTSVVFLFLSGLTWPRYAMSGFWQLVGDAIPATWGVEGFVRINGDNGSLAQQAHCMRALWILVGVYFSLAWVLFSVRRSFNRKAAPTAPKDAN